MALLDILKASGYFVPLARSDPASPIKRLQSLVQAAGAAVLLTSPQLAAKCEYLELPASGTGTSVMIVGEAERTPCPTLLPHSYDPHRRSQGLSRQVSPHGLYPLLKFTWGSTGAPKEVVVEHRAVCSTVHTCGFGRPHRYRTGLPGLPLQLVLVRWHAVGRLRPAYPRRVCVCIPSEDERINDLAGAITRFGANTINLSTSVSRLIKPSGVPRLKTMCLGGELVLQSDMERWASHLRLIASQLAIYRGLFN